MSIDARIEMVTYEADGTATLWLAPRDNRVGPAGQRQLTILNPLPGLEYLQGECIWGGDKQIMIGDLHWADREGYTRIRIRDTIGDALKAAGIDMTKANERLREMIARHKARQEATCPTAGQ